MSLYKLGYYSNLLNVIIKTTMQDLAKNVVATIVEAMPCHSTMALGKNSVMQGEPNSAMVFNTKRCRERHNREK